MRAAIFVAVLLAVGHLAAAQDAECPFKEADLSAVKWSNAKKACAAPEPGFCSACICGLKNTILEGLTAKGIKVAPADEAGLITNCLGALATPLVDPAVGNMTDEVTKLTNCGGGDYAAIAAKCPAAPTTKPAPTPKAGASPAPTETVALPEATPSPAAVAAVPAASPAVAAAVPSPPPKSAAGAVVASMGAVAAVGLLQAMLF